MTFFRPRQIKSNYEAVAQSPESIATIKNAKCTIEAVTLFALADTFDFDDDIISARISEFAALASEFCASPDDMQNILVAHDKSLAISRKSEWQQRWEKDA